MPEPLPTAYCAPGRKVTAELALSLRGERVAEVVEHPWLTGEKDVLMIAPHDLAAEPLNFQMPPLVAAPHRSYPHESR